MLCAPELTAASASRSPGYNSLTRGLEILKTLQMSGAATAQELSELVGLPLSTVYRYWRVLIDAGFAAEVDGTLVATDLLAERHVEGENLVDAAAPVMDQLRNKYHLTTVLAVRVHTAMLSLHSLGVARSRHIAFRVGQMRPLHAGATALALLAWAPRAVIDEVCRMPLRRYTAETIVDGAQLKRELNRIQTVGYVRTESHATPGMSATAVPIEIRGFPGASLSLLGCGDEDRLYGDRLIEDMLCGARAISSAIDLKF